MSYYVIVVFIFPVDPIKVLHNTEVRVVEALSEDFSDLMRLVRPPTSETKDEENEEDEEAMPILLKVKERRKKVWDTLRAVRACLGTAAGEPIIHGMPYPVLDQQELVPVLRRLAASVDIVLLGLLHTHRPRPGGMDGNIQQVFERIQPIVQNIDRYCMYVMQDFVDAVHKPTVWSYDGAARNFSVLRQLAMKLREAFKSAYEDIITGLRENAEQIKRGKFMQKRLDESIEHDGETSMMECVRVTSPYGRSLSIEEMLDCEELTAPRNASFLLAPEDLTINHDMNMSIAVLVGIDLFCTQVKKTMRAASQLNAFERSRRHC
uniref:Uncharacterized protein TCIL3000_7_190 n=1 Tax=Trypanosoma congolense (strain IL3000) TaxID=1068625 RepID=G0UPA9_TRYCI|nr:unnamed protein product [Trypanosoma congolense IL3000]